MWKKAGDGQPHGCAREDHTRHEGEVYSPRLRIVRTVRTLLLKRTLEVGQRFLNAVQERLLEVDALTEIAK